MFNKKIKLVLAILVLAYAVYQFIEAYIGNGIFLTFLAGIFILFYFKNEILIFAFLRLRKQDFEGTKRWLSRLKNPKASLVRKQEGYYNYLNGIIVSQSNLAEAEKYFKKALSLGLNFSHDTAMAKLSLAGIVLQKRRLNEAKQLLNEAKKLDKRGMLADQIKMIQQQIRRVPGQRGMQMGNQSYRALKGGKRR